MRDFRELSREQILDGVVANMAVAIELTQKVIDPMIAKKFGRIVNITSATREGAARRTRSVVRRTRRPHRIHGGRCAIGRRTQM